MKALSKSAQKKLSAYIAELEAMYEAIDEMVSAEQEKFDGKSERWQESDAGEEAQELISALESIRDNSESLKDEMAKEAAPLIGDSASSESAASCS